MRLKKVFLLAGAGIFVAFLVMGNATWANGSDAGLMKQIAQSGYGKEKPKEAEKAKEPEKPAAAAKPAAETKAAPEMLEKGKKIYTQLCATCHGPKGDGQGVAAAALNPKPATFTDTQWKYGGSDQEITTVITKGVPGTAMVSFAAQLKEDDLKAVVAYVKSLSKK